MFRPLLLLLLAIVLAGPNQAHALEFFPGIGRAPAANGKKASRVSPETYTNGMIGSTLIVLGTGVVAYGFYSLGKTFRFRSEPLLGKKSIDGGYIIAASGAVIAGIGLTIMVW